jgi:hypothetical protein
MFLVLFSYVILCDFFPIYAKGFEETRLGIKISILEVILIIWIISFTFDEIREVNYSTKHTFS